MAGTAAGASCMTKPGLCMAACASRSVNGRNNSAALCKCVWCSQVKHSSSEAYAEARIACMAQPRGMPELSCVQTLYVQVMNPKVRPPEPPPPAPVWKRMFGGKKTELPENVKGRCVVKAG